MISKETFVHCIETIKDQRDRENKFLAGLDAVSPETNNDTFIYSSYEALVVDLLMEELDDRGEVLSWWIYEANFGLEEKFRSLFIDDVEIELDTAEKVYNYLTK